MTLVQSTMNFPDDTNGRCDPLARWIFACLLVFAPGFVIAQESEVPKQASKSGISTTPAVQRVAIDEARRQAELLHSAMHITLHLVHHRMYREDESLPLPAAVVDEVFQDFEAEEHVKMQWLVVQGLAMNIDHLAKTPFEQEAVKALEKGAKFFERIEEGTYRRAGPIVLSNHCLKCHVPDRKSTENRVAGLIVSIPVKAP